MLSTEGGVREKQNQRLASTIILLAGMLLLAWFIIHAVYNAINGIVFDFWSLISVWRLILGILCTVSGYILLSIIDWEK